MKKLLLGTAISLAMVGSASAADMYVKAAPAYNWSGFYIGLQDGYGWGRVDDSYVPPFANLNGVSTTRQPYFGAHLGWQKQFAGNWVLGVEGGVNEPLQKNSISNFISSSCGNPAAFTCGLETIRSNYYVGGRLGLAWGDTLFTVSGGYTSAVFKREDPSIANPAIQDNGGQWQSVHQGEYVGAAIEHVFARLPLADFIVGVDYKHEFYPNKVDIDAAGFGHNTQVGLDMAVVRGTLKFK